ncbi:MAG: tripartite tricarboxylate transporter substrate binding protein [Rhodospirillaceae bacterium]
MPNNRTKIALCSALVALLASWFAGGAAAAPWAPGKPVEIVAMSGPGGANDVIARALQRHLQNEKLVAVPITVTNRPGAGGVLAWTYLNQHAGDGGYLSVSPINLITEHIAGASPITYSDVTPVAQLFNEYVVWSVHPESGLTDMKGVIARLRKDPGSVSFAVAAALGGANHIAASLAAKSAGIDVRRLKFVVFNSGPQSLTAVMGRHVDVAVAPVAGTARVAQGEKLKMIGVSSPQRLWGLMRDVPTWREQDVIVVFSSWRGVIGPKDMTADQLAYWERAIERMTQSEAWKRELERNY